MQDFSYHRRTRLHFGKDSLNKLADELPRFGEKVLLVTGGASVRKSGLYDGVMVQLIKSGKKVFEVSGVKPNPRVESVREGVAICKKEKIDLVLGVGGGSTIDAAKGMAAGALYTGDVWDLYQYKVPCQDALPIGCVLTLAATGTEMNGNSVVTNFETGEKLGLVTPLALQPTFSILDPTNTFTVPPDHTANGCVDIMVHVFEQYFSQTHETPLQDRMAEAVLVTMIENARRVHKRPMDYDARANVMWCGTIALNDILGLGKSGDWASHVMEHELSAIYDIAHGAGLAIVAPQWMKHVLDAGVGKFEQYARRVWGVTNPDPNAAALEGIEKTKAFFHEIGAPVTLKEVGIDASRLAEMAKKATRNGPIGGYKKLTAADVEAILKASL
jgi:alcohol dehydrogenase YqhD (iron-dependent ADH family)